MISRMNVVVEVDFHDEQIISIIYQVFVLIVLFYKLKVRKCLTCPCLKRYDHGHVFRVYDMTKTTHHFDIMYYQLLCHLACIYR